MPSSLESVVARSLIGLIPQWYESSEGANLYQIGSGEHSVSFASPRALTPHLGQLHQLMQSDLPSFLRRVSSPPKPGELELIHQELALEWLNINCASIAWTEVLRFLLNSRRRTYENASISKNIVINPSAIGNLDLSDSRLEKGIDPLGSSSFTYLEVDASIRLVGCGQVTWGEVHETQDYKLSPEFVQPILSRLAADQFSAHLTSRGDILFCSRSGLIASYRQGTWHLYDAATLKNALTSFFGDYRVGANLFETLFDLSYKRHGALLIYDPENQIQANLINRDSLLSECSAECTPLHHALAPTIRDLAIGEVDSQRRQKRILHELASLDGAVVFDANRLIAVGAMVAPHTDVPHTYGARSSAAMSAALHGARAAKVSSDGEISIFSKQDSIVRRLDFL